MLNIHTLDVTDNNLGPKGATYVAELIRENNFIKYLVSYSLFLCLSVCLSLSLSLFLLPPSDICRDIDSQMPAGLSILQALFNLNTHGQNSKLFY